MLNENELDLKLIDFGTACQFNPLVGMTRIVGTVIYMAPELLMNESEACYDQ